MGGWHATTTAPAAGQLALFETLPLGLNPRWLGTRVDNTEARIVSFLFEDQASACGYAAFIAHPGALSYCLGETTLFRVPVLRYAAREVPLCKDETALPRIFEPLREAIGQRGVAFFEGVPIDSSFGRLLAQPHERVRCEFHVVPYGPVYTHRLIDLPAGAQFEDYLAMLGSKTREDVRRTRRKIGERAQAAVRVARYTQPEQVDELAAALHQVSTRTYQHHLLGLGLQNTPAQRDRLRAAARGGWLRAYILWIGERPAAFGLGYLDGCTYYGHDIGYDPEFAKLQPGIYLHTEVMADLLADDIRRFDFMAGDSLYKQRMSTTSRQERHYYLIPRGWPGSACALAMTAVNGLSEGVGRLLDRGGLRIRIKRFVRAMAVRRGVADA